SMRRTNRPQPVTEITPRMKFAESRLHVGRCVTTSLGQILRILRRARARDASAAAINANDSGPAPPDVQPVASVRVVPSAEVVASAKAASSYSFSPSSSPRDGPRETISAGALAFLAEAPVPALFPAATAVPALGSRSS